MMNQNLVVQLKTDTLKALFEGVKHLANEIKEDKLHVPEIEQYALATKNLSEAAEKLDKIDPVALA